MGENIGGPTDFTGGGGLEGNATVGRASTGVAQVSRAKAARAARRAQQFAKFRNTTLNLVPLVDTLVSIVFFALTTATVGELIPVIPGINLPVSRVGENALQQLTLGVGPQVTIGGRPIMPTLQAATAVSNNPSQPLLIPALFTALKAQADSIRQEKNLTADQSVETTLAIQGDKTMRYDLLSRIMQTARLAGFRNLSLQVQRTGTEGAAPQPSS
jgi:biopolymer transport protein ExbD